MALSVSGATTLDAVHTAAAAPRYNRSESTEGPNTEFTPSQVIATLSSTNQLPATTSSASTTADLHLRAGPSLQDQILTTMPRGSAVAITGSAQKGFYPVVYRGMQGWAYGAYLATGGSSPLVGGSSPLVAGSSVPTTTSVSGGSIVAIITAAATRYGQSPTAMLRVATCESSLNPTAVNAASGTAGLFQFLPSTWASTPYAGYSPTDPWANANAAAWMWSVGRRSAWVCQ